MLYWFILGGLFLGGGVYVMLHGAKIVHEDAVLQDNKAKSHLAASGQDHLV